MAGFLDDEVVAHSAFYDVHVDLAAGAVNTSSVEPQQFMLDTFEEIEDEAALIKSVVAKSKALVAKLDSMRSNGSALTRDIIEQNVQNNAALAEFLYELATVEGFLSEK